MKKTQILITIGLTIASVICYAQNIGIGEPNPGSKLSVKGGMSVGESYSSQTAPAGSLIIEKNVGIGTFEIDSNAILDIRSTTKGIILPRMSKTQRESITTPAPGLFVFDTDSNTLFFSNGTNWFNFPAVDLVNNTVIGIGNTALSGLGGLSGGGGNSNKDNVYYNKGTDDVTISSSSWTDLSGLSKTFTLSDNAKVIVQTSGGIKTTSTNSSGYSVVDVAVYVDGNQVNSTYGGGLQRMYAQNSSGYKAATATWSTGCVLDLSSGSHTIVVKARKESGSNAIVSGSDGEFLQGNLITQVVY